MGQKMSTAWQELSYGSGDALCNNAFDRLDGSCVAVHEMEPEAASKFMQICHTNDSSKMI